MTIESESVNKTNSTNTELQNDLQQIMKEHERTGPTVISQCSRQDIGLLKAEMPYGPDN